MVREEKEWGGEIEGKWEREEDLEEGEGVKESGKERGKRVLMRRELQCERGRREGRGRR